MSALIYNVNGQLPKIVGISTESSNIISTVIVKKRVTVHCEDNSVWVKQYTNLEEAISLPWIRIG
jgi:hypothetical protein